MIKAFKGKIILVTGGAGSIGSELVEQLLQYKPKQIRVLSRDESKQYELLEKLSHPKNLRLFIGDVRDKERLDLAFKNVDIVIHAAALKHVPFCEYNPFETIKTNIVGSQNVIEAALKNKVKKVIAISTDKAANPNNVMGVSKLMMEKLFVNANYYGSAGTIFSCVRFGNVAWARGSVLPFWQKQAERFSKINVTNSEMTRFLMSKKEACNLILKAIELARGKEIFVLKMPAIKLGDLANLFIKKYFFNKNIKIKNVGSRAGEKMHEELLNASEDLKILSNHRMFIILPKVKIYGLEEKKIKNYPGFKEVKVCTYSSNLYLDNKKINEII
ncbi:MAG: SDR family NAD(P)-dependent oxidoreductase [Patescibacteria group bacterium]|jgi:FlaA1/EpsC-like NDP-sugar epimerase